MAKLADAAEKQQTARRRVTFERKLRDGTTKSETVDLRLLSAHELDLCRVAAAAYVDSLDAQARVGDRGAMIEQAESIEVLARALLVPDKDDPWSGVETLRKKIDSYTMNLLAEEYETHARESVRIVSIESALSQALEPDPATDDDADLMFEHDGPPPMPVTP